MESNKHIFFCLMVSVTSFMYAMDSRDSGSSSENFLQQKKLTSEEKEAFHRHLASPGYQYYALRCMKLRESIMAAPESQIKREDGQKEKVNVPDASKDK